jgi:hypothetical protein
MPLLVSVRSYPNSAPFFPHIVRITHHGGLTPAALVNLRSCIAKIVFSPANVRTATRAGGVSPPWDVLGMRTRNVEIRRIAVATVVSDRQAADAGRWTNASATAIALPHHGGLTPAALGCRFGRLRTMLLPLPYRVRITQHGRDRNSGKRRR